MKQIFLIKFIIFVLLSTFAASAFAYFTGAYSFSSNQALQITDADVSAPKYSTVVIDAGHGGEDGGASSADGLVEKHVNLEISQMLRDMLTASGINVVMTREDDRLLYDRNVDFHGRKKKLDLAARLSIAESTPDSIFVSIHMNSYTNPKYSGLQVWYSQNDPESYSLAQSIQSRVQNDLQPDNRRTVKAAGSSIFLLENATSPAVLIECGFLSNPDEAKKLETAEYKQALAFSIFCAITEFLNADS